MDILPSTEAQQEYIHRRLQAHNAGFMTESANFSFHIEENDTIVAGIVAESVGDTVEVAYLFVEQVHRGRGLGKLLLERVEAAAREAGMQRVLLNTYSFQAPGFYERMGYREVLKLDPAFDRFSQHYFIKEL